MQYSSAEGRKSKYQSSSKKINSLFEEFQQLKQRINVPKQQFPPNNSIQEILSPQKERPVRKLSFTATESNKKSTQLINKSYEDFQIQVGLKKCFQKIINQQIPIFSKNMNEKVKLMENRLGYLNQLFIQVCKLIKMKTSNEKSLKGLKKCNCRWKGLDSKQIQEKYQKKIKQIVSSYENKISLLVKETSNKQTSASSKDGSIPALKEEIKNMEDEMMVKDKELTESKLENSRLRRLSDKLNNLIKSKDDLIKELTQQIQQKQKQIDKIGEQGKIKDAEIEQLKKKCQNNSEFEIMNIKLLQERAKLQISNKRLSNELILIREEQTKKQSQNIRQSLKSKEWNESYIPQREALSDFENNDDDLLRMDDIDIYQPLRHSHFIHTGPKKNFAYENRIKQLQSELQLQIQENRLLKGKKDKFQEQVKDNEEDEEKFQIQSQIFREQLKRVNGSLKNLDECAVILLYGNKLSSEKIETLEQDIQLKKEYFKKYPKRSSSKSSKRK